MVEVALYGAMKAAAGDRSSVAVEATNLRELLDALARDYPELAPHLARGVSVAIDGEIYTENWFQPIRPDSEVVLLPMLKGG